MLPKNDYENKWIIPRWDWTGQLSDDPARNPVPDDRCHLWPLNTKKKAVITMEIKSKKWELFMPHNPGREDTAKMTWDLLHLRGALQGAGNVCQAPAGGAHHHLDEECQRNPYKTNLL